MIRLRPATEADALQLLRWRNDPGTYRRCIVARPVGREEHLRWFRDRLRSPRTTIYILLDAAGRAAGQGRIDRGRGSCEISLGLGRESRGRGLGTAAVRALTARAFRLGARKVVATIKKDNVASVLAFIKAGFRFVRCARTRGQDVYLMEKTR